MVKAGVSSTCSAVLAGSLWLGQRGEPAGDRGHNRMHSRTGNPTRGKAGASPRKSLPDRSVEKPQEESRTPVVKNSNRHQP